MSSNRSHWLSLFRPRAACLPGASVRGPRPWSSARRRLSRRLGVERLDERLPLAGNVVASVVNNQLNVMLDSADNFVQVSSPSPGIVRVTGIGTKINGGNAAVDFANIKWLSMTDAGGNDVVRVEGLRMLDGWIDIELDPANQAGNDTLYVRDCQAKFAVSASVDPSNSSAGQDYVWFENIQSSQGTVDVFTGDEGSGVSASDQVWMTNVSAPTQISVVTGVGNDTISLSQFSSSNVRVEADGLNSVVSHGHDWISLYNGEAFDLGVIADRGDSSTGVDTVTLNSLYTTLTYVGTAGGADTVTMTNSVVFGGNGAEFFLGGSSADNDVLKIAYSYIGSGGLYVGTEGGADFVSIDHCVIDDGEFGVFLGAGNDILYVTNCQFKLPLVTINLKGNADVDFFYGFANTTSQGTPLKLAPAAGFEYVFSV